MTNLVWLLLILENVLSVVLLVYSFVKLNGRTTLKYIFIGVLFFNLLWANGVLIVRLPGIAAETAELLSKGIFFASISMLITFGLFIYYFIHSITDKKTEGWRRILFWVFEANAMFLLVSVFLGLIERGVRTSEIGYSPIYGILHKYMVFSMLAFGIYFFYLLFEAYRNSDTEQQKFQLARVFRYSGIAFSIMIVTNGLVPALMNNSAYSILGTMALMVLYTGLLFLLIKGYTLLLTSQFKALVRTGVAQSEQNIQSIRQFIELLRFLIQDGPNKFRRQLEFVTQGKDLVRVVIQHMEERGLAKKESIDGLLNKKWLEGTLDTLLRQERENRHLVFSLIRAEQLLNDRMLTELAGYLPETTVKLSHKSYRISDYLEDIENNLRENEESFGQKMLCFSPVSKKVLERMRASCYSTQSVIFSGEPGTGRATLAKAMHFHREGGSLREISCFSASPEEMRAEIKQFLDSTEPKAGLLIKNLEAYDAAQLRILEPILRDFDGTKFVYFTCQPKFLQLLNKLSRDIQVRLVQIVIETVPLRKRTDDVFYLTLYFANKFAVQLGKRFESISNKLIQKAKKAPWQGNVAELQTSIRNSLLLNKLPELTELQIEHMVQLLAIETGGKFNPLEQAERKVIEQYLILNSYHLTNTCKQLGLTINTLKARMKKYSIPSPRSKA